MSCRIARIRVSGFLINFLMAHRKWNSSREESLDAVHRDDEAVSVERRQRDGGSTDAVFHAHLVRPDACRLPWTCSTEAHLRQ